MKNYTKNLATLILISAALTACSSTQTFTVGDGKGQAVVTTDGSGSGTVKVHGSDGQETTMDMGTNAAYPGTLPFPQYPSSKVTLTMNNSASGSQENSTVSLDTSDGVEKIIAHYRSWFNSNGWKINAETSTQGMGSLTAQKDDGTASIMAMPGSDHHTTIQIILSKDKK